VGFLQGRIYPKIFKRRIIAEYITYIYSILSHWKYSFRERNTKDLYSNKYKLNYYLTKHYHIVEKGLALPSPRLAFGKEKINDIIDKSEVYIKLYGQNSTIISIKKCLECYLEFNKSIDLPEDYEKKITSFLEKIEENGEGGTKELNKKTTLEKGNIPFHDFVTSRNSVRDFSSDSIEHQVINNAVNSARYSPSVCNRQGWFVHYYSNKEQISKLLSHQNGNSGFTDSVDKLLIVTGDLRAFTRFEHNQLFIDGGLFSMNLMLALHSLGVGTCPLNTCCDLLTENKIKTIGNIGKSERLIMYIAVGNLKEKYKVAISSRQPVENILVGH
jgi:nitroreductase